MTKKCAVFIHTALMDGCSARVNLFLSLIRSSGLYEKIDTIFVCCVGTNNELCIDTTINDKIKIMRLSTLLEDYEVPTQKMLYDFCKANPDYNVLYIHTKGVGKEMNMYIEDWIHYMLYFLIEQHDTALTQLKDHATVGVDLLQEPTLHYSGNFWWARASYIKELPDPTEFRNLTLYPNPLCSARHNQEFWICYKKQNHCSLWQSNINCYERHLHRYGREQYAQG